MKRKCYTDEQIICTRRQYESGISVQTICRDMGIAQGTFYRSKSLYGVMEVADAKRLRELESVNGKLKGLLGRLCFTIPYPKEVVSKKW